VLNQVRSGNCLACSGRSEMGQPPLGQSGLGYFFQFLSGWVKKISIGWAKKYPCQSQVSLWFTVGYARDKVGSRPMSTLDRKPRAVKISYGSTSKIFDPGLGHFLVARVSHLWVWKISHKNPKFFNFSFLIKNCIGLGQKIRRPKTGWPLIYCESKVCSGRVKTCHKSRLTIFISFCQKKKAWMA